MRYLFGLFFFLMFASFLVTGGIWVLYRLFTGFSGGPNSKATDRLVKQLRKQLQAARTKLVPWDKEMLSLLSLNKSEERKANAWGRPASGTYQSIYHEPVVTYAKQRVGKTELILVQTSEKEFVFKRKGNETSIWVNGNPLGVFIDGLLMAPGNKSALLASLEKNESDADFHLDLDKNPAAAITNPEKASGPNPRAMTLLRDLSEKEEETVLALTMLQAVEEKK
ncbi:MAG: hypothetical protein R2792_20255 [Saprospiraceae bacterium]